VAIPDPSRIRLVLAASTPSIENTSGPATSPTHAES
jgi:hypothetical protein